MKKSVFTVIKYSNIQRSLIFWTFKSLHLVLRNTLPRLATNDLDLLLRSKNNDSLDRK